MVARRQLQDCSWANWTSPISRPTAPRGRSWRASCATARCRLPACRGPMRPPTTRSSAISRPGAISSRSRSRIRDAPRSIGSTERSTGMPFAICWRSRLTSRTCYRPTTSVTASTISETCCRYRPYCWSGTCPSHARSAGPPSAIPRCPWPIRPIPFLMGSFRTIVWTKPRRPARAAAASCATCSRWTANMRFRSTYKGAETTSIWASSGNASSISGSTINGSRCSPLRPAKRRSCSAAERPPMRTSRSASR